MTLQEKNDGTQAQAIERLFTTTFLLYADSLATFKHRYPSYHGAVTIQLPLPSWLAKNAQIKTDIYIDIVRLWVPDSLIFLLSGYSIYCVASGRIGLSPEEQGMSALMFVSPFLLMNGFSGIKKSALIFASGDIYVALSIGWLDKGYAVVVSGGAILLALCYGAIFRQPHLPFIPFMLFVFFIYGLI